MDVICYGMGLNCERVIEKLNKSEDLHLIALADSYKKENKWNMPMINLAENVEEHKDTAIVISVTDVVSVQQIYYQLAKLGYRNIYRFLNKTYCWNTDFLNGECVKLENIGSTWLPRLEMHAANHCNLNCKCCTHFSPLFENDLPNYEQSMNDLKKLQELVGGAFEFNLIGGEPLLNPRISDYIVLVKENLSIVSLYIITNGILIPKLDEDTLKCFHDNNVILSISEYEPTHKMIDKIKDKLETYQIDYYLSPYDKKSKFYKLLTLSEHEPNMKECFGNVCVNVGNGKIARCPMILYLDKLNARFGLNLPKEGIYSLDEFKDGIELKDKLMKEFPLCGYCRKQEVSWSQCGKEIKMEDFIGID